MVSYSKYSQVKQFRNNENVKRIANKKTKFKKKNQTSNIYKNRGKITKKRKYTKKTQFLGSNKKKTRKHTPKKINLNKEMILMGGFFRSCNIPKFKKIKNKFDKLNKKFDNVVKEQTIYVETIEKKTESLKVIYATLFFTTKKLFFNDKIKRNLNSTTEEILPVITNIKNLEANRNSLQSDVKIKNIEFNKIVVNSKKKIVKFKKVKKNYNKEFKKYTITNTNTVKKSNFTYKMIKIKNDVDTYDKVLKDKDVKSLDKDNKKIYNKVKRCKEKYDKAIEFYDEFTQKIGENEFAADTIINKLQYLQKYYNDCKKEFDIKTNKFVNWITNGKDIYDILQSLIPLESATLTPPNIVKLPSYDDLKPKLTRILDLLKQSALVTINVNMVTEMEYVIQFIDKIIASQGAIKTDLVKLKSDFMKHRTGEYLKTIITEIIMAHNDNIQALSVIKIHLENIVGDEVIPIFTDMNIFPEIMGTARATAQRNLLGVGDGSTSTLGVNTGLLRPLVGGAKNSQRGGYTKKTNIDFTIISPSIDYLHLDIIGNFLEDSFNTNFHTIYNKFFTELKNLVTFATTSKGFYNSGGRVRRGGTIEIINSSTNNYNLQNHKKVIDLVLSDYFGLSAYNSAKNDFRDNVKYISDNINILSELLNKANLLNEINYIIKLYNNILSIDTNATNNIYELLRRMFNNITLTNSKESSIDLPNIISQTNYNTIKSLFDNFNTNTNTDYIIAQTLPRLPRPTPPPPLPKKKIYEIFKERIVNRKKIYEEIKKFEDNYDSVLKLKFIDEITNVSVIDDYRNDYMFELNKIYA